MSQALPDVDCWRLAKIIRSGRFSSPTLPIVVVTDTNLLTGADAIAQALNVFTLPLADIDVLEQSISEAIAARRRVRVLIIEDDRDAAQTAERALESEYITEVAYDGASGLTAWQRRRHDLVLLDLMLPAMSGEEVLKAILKIEPKQPVIIVTAYASRERHKSLMLLGANEFVEKPFDINVLRGLCRNLFQEIALSDGDKELSRAREAMRRTASKAGAASLNLKQGRTEAASHQLEQLVADVGRDLTDDEWVEVLNDVGRNVP